MPRDEGRYRGGRLLPTFPGGRWLPVLLAAIGVALLALGLVRGDVATTALGAAALGVVLIGFVLGPLLLGGDNEDDDEQEAAHRDDS